MVLVVGFVILTVLPLVLSSHSFLLKYLNAPEGARQSAKKSGNVISLLLHMALSTMYGYMNVISWGKGGVYAM